VALIVEEDILAAGVIRPAQANAAVALAVRLERRTRRTASLEAAVGWCDSTRATLQTLASISAEISLN
jgi:hypothetical protein